MSGMQQAVPFGMSTDQIKKRKIKKQRTKKTTPRLASLEKKTPTSVNKSTEWQKYRVDEVAPWVLCARPVGDGLSTNIRSGRAGGERWQVLNRNDMLAETKPVVDVVDPSWCGMISLNIPAPPVAPVSSLGENLLEEQLAESFQEICSAEILQGSVLELSGKIKRRPLKVLIDFGSTSNFISDQVVASLHLKVVEDGIRQKLILLDKSIIWPGGWVDFLLTCGEYVRRISARVFPSFHKELILGMPWLVMEDPDISRRNRTVAVQQKGSFVQLPVLRPAHNIPQVD